jgi:hypothetical protein
MRTNLALGVCLAVALGTAGCQDKTELTSPPEGTESPSLALGGVTLQKGRLKLPASARVTDHFNSLARRAVTPTACHPSTPVTTWFLGEFNEFRLGEPTLYNILYVNNLADLLPTYDALLFLTENTPQFFGYNGEYNQIMTKVERDTKRFWDIFSDDIQLIGMHGTMVQDVARSAAVYQAVFEIAPGVPVPPALAQALAQQNRTALLASEILDGGNHPLFSFNAFAFSDFEGPIPDKIVMGDGILAGYDAVGLGDVAPQGVYGHEFAHHIQFENDYFSDNIPGSATPNQAERTRYTELMADAMSAYYLTHSRGAALNKKRVAQFLQVFFQIGDCAFNNPGHHGTPLQRMAAAEFGFQLADEAQKQGHILPSEEVHDRFVAIYTTLID